MTIRSRLLTTALVAGSAAVGFAPLAVAASSTTLPPAAEAWYQPNPSCPTPAGCLTTGALPPAPPAPTPFPAGTLHVGLAGGQETARSYLGFALAALAGRTVTAGTLTIPLDVSPSDGSTSPETAKVQACLVTAPIRPAAGSVDAPPKPDCSSAATVTYAAKPAPHLQADLAPLLSSLPNAAGLALLPDATKAGPTDSWRVVFSTHDRTGTGKTPPAALTLTLADPAPAGTVAPPATVPTRTGSGLTSVPPPANTSFAAPAALAAPALAGPQQPAAPVVAAAAPAPVAAAPRFVTVGYAYPVVWLLPIAFLVLVPLATRALTKDLTPQVR